MAMPNYRLLTFDRQTGIGVAGSMHVSLAAVAKTNGPNAPYCVANELICAELGRFLRLPIPPCGVVRGAGTDRRAWFASMDFNLTGNSLPPVDAARCCREMPSLSTGLLLFDMLVGNSDRHRSNLSADFSTNPYGMSVFDHGHALFGDVAGQGAARLVALRDEFALAGGSITGGNPHCFLDVLKTAEYFSTWLDRIGMLPDYLIEELCRDAAELGITMEDAGEAVRFLKHRREGLRGLIDAHRGEFHGIEQWSLFP